MSIAQAQHMKELAAMVLELSARVAELEKKIAERQTLRLKEDKK